MVKLLRTILVLITTAILFFGCSAAKEEQQAELKNGIWRGVLSIQGEELPFNFEIKTENNSIKAYLINAEEKLELDSIVIENHSVYMPMHIFDADIKAKIEGDKLIGHWTKNYAEDYRIPFTATHGDKFRFKSDNKTPYNSIEGNWQVTFVHDNDTTESVAIFEQKKDRVIGTYLTPTGDYRYLEGIMDGDQLKISTFDGGHAFLFTALLLEDGSLKGDYWSGKSWHEEWTAVKDSTASIPDPDEITFLKDGYSKIDFSFPGLSGNQVTPNDPKYKDKILILQLFGTWCPNCMDETKFLKSWYDENQDRGVEILALAYEAKSDFDYAKGRVLKMKRKLGVNYDFVIAGTSNKQEASKTLPMLNSISSFPTTIFIDKTGLVRRIHTGFTGPGTGVYYDDFIKEFNLTVDELLDENYLLRMLINDSRLI